MWNVNIINAGHTLSSGEREIMEQAYKLKLEKYGPAAVKMMRDETAGLEAALEHFELGHSAWAWVCGQAWEAAMDAIGWAPDVEFDEVWIDE